MGASAFCVLFEKFDRIADRQDGLCGVIGNFAAGLFLEGHDEFDGVEAVGAEVVDKASIVGDLVGFDTQMLNDDLFYSLANVTHRCTLVSLNWARSVSAREPLQNRACLVFRVGSPSREPT